MHRASITLTAVLLVGCPTPDPAPEELSDLLTFAWSHYSFEIETNEISLADAGRNFETWFIDNVESLDDYDIEVGFGASLIEPEDRLADEVLTDLDPPPQFATGANAVGVVVGIHTECTLADIDRIYTIDDQLSLHPDNYVSYERTDTANYACFVDGTCDEFEWVSNITNALALGTEATFRLHNKMRRISAEALDGTQVEARLGRTWMSEEATLDPSTTGRWFQNYQIEYILERPDGVLHIYPQWVEVEIGEINTEGNAFLNGYLDGLLEYILRLEQHCIDGTGT
jgi:hypothetical protein